MNVIKCSNNLVSLVCIFYLIKADLILIFFQTVKILDMRRDVQEIFRSTPHEKQVMMFSATLSKEIRPVCKKFMQEVITRLVNAPDQPFLPKILNPTLKNPKKYEKWKTRGC